MTFWRILWLETESGEWKGGASGDKTAKLMKLGDFRSFLPVSGVISEEKLVQMNSDFRKNGMQSTF